MPTISWEIIISCTWLQHVARHDVDYRWDTLSKKKKEEKSKMGHSIWRQCPRYPIRLAAVACSKRSCCCHCCYSCSSSTNGWFNCIWDVVVVSICSALSRLRVCFLPYRFLIAAHLLPGRSWHNFHTFFRQFPLGLSASRQFAMIPAGIIIVLRSSCAWQRLRPSKLPAWLVLMSESQVSFV